MGPKIRVAFWFGMLVFAQDEPLPEFVHTIESNITRVPVTVVGGRPDRELIADDFALYEDGIQQEIRYFEAGSKLTLGLIIDCTRSMRGSMADARQAALAVLANLGERDRAFIVVYGMNRKPHVLVRPTDKRRTLTKAIKRLAAHGGGSHVWDAVSLGLDQITPVTGKVALVLISDADDQTSRHSLSQLTARLATGDVPLHMIALNVQSKTNRQRVDQLASAAGGLVRYTEEAQELTALLQAIVTHTQDQYLLGYQSTGAGQGKARTIRVEPVGAPQLTLNWRRQVAVQ